MGGGGLFDWYSSAEIHHLVMHKIEQNTLNSEVILVNVRSKWKGKLVQNEAAHSTSRATEVNLVVNRSKRSYNELDFIACSVIYASPQCTILTSTQGKT